MNFSTKLFIDKVVGAPLTYLLNILVMVYAFIVKHDHSLKEDFKRIALCKLVGMGSIIELTPLLQTLRFAYPSARILFVTTRNMAPLLEKLGLCHEIIIIDDRNLFALAWTSLLAVVRLWRRRVDLYLDFELFSNFSSILTTLSLARNRLGYFKRSFKYRSGIYNYLIYLNTKVPIVEIFLQVARLLECKTLTRTLTRIAVSDQDRSLLAEKVSSSAGSALPSYYIVVNPNASDLRIERRWEPDKFAKLINRIANRYTHVRVVLIGAASEKPYVDALCGKVDRDAGARVLNLAGRLTIAELLALIDGAMLLVTNDSGPMHLAFAQNVKTVALWGPGHPKHFGDYPHSFAIYKDVYCSPCIYEFETPPCKGNNQCMKLIAVDEVFQAVEGILEGKEGPWTRTDGAMLFAEASGAPLGLITR